MVLRVLGHAVAMSLVGIVAAGLGVVSTPAPAAAETCSPGAGVSVVVDFRELGGGLQTLCDAAGGGKSAAALLSDNGYAVTYANQQPGFVCRVSGVPASDPCVATSPTSAYWGLYWSDGSTGSWAYASRGADSLAVPAGGSVAFAWQGSGQRGAPAVAPPAAAAAPTATTAPTSTAPTPTSPTTSTSGTSKPTEKPTKKPTTKPTTKPARTPTSTPTRSGTSSATPSSPSSPTDSPSTTDPSEPATTGSPSLSASGPPSGPATVDPSESETTSTAPAPSPTSSDPAADQVEPTAAETDSGRVPTWLTLTILVLLLIAIGISALAARRRTHH